ncbi:MAG TPA: YbjQ family protein [Solirubrobacteraceae bacterium]|nr:YbjQ family protein [Solirubrobacteraceae bacterium]
MRAASSPRDATLISVLAYAGLGGRRFDPGWLHWAGSVRRMGASREMPMTTAFELPGYRVTENLGVCYGLVVRSMGLVGGVASSFKALRRGEVGQYTQLLEESRRHAIDRMVENASLMGADGLLGVRFDSSEIGQQLTEIVAYGTAVKLAAERL